MAFSLTKKAKLANPDISLWKVEHIEGNEFITILLDVPLRLETNSVDREILIYLEKILQKVGITSYVITTALRKYPTEKELKVKKSEFYSNNDSHWFEEIIKPARAKGMIANVVVPFGSALYQITKTGTVFTVEDLIYPAFENYVYIGHGWIGDYDCFLFPQFPIMEVFCPGTPNKVELQGWKMNFMITVFRKIAAKQYQLPDDITTPKLIEIGSLYDTDKAVAIQEIKDFLNLHFNSEICAFDLETSGFNQWKDKIRCITLAFDSATGYYMEWKPFAENKELVDLLSKMLLSCKKRITVNGKFDVKFLWVNGVDTEVTVTEDAMTLCHVLCSGRKKGLKTQTFFWTPFGGYDHALDTYRDNLKKQGIPDPSYYDIPKDTLMPYATMDAVMTVRVFLAGEKRMHKFDHDYPTEKPIEHTGGHAYTMWEWYRFIMKIYPIVCKMEYEGLYVDEHIIELHRGVFRKKVQDAREKLAKIFNVSPDFEFSSTTQLGRLLEQSGWPCHGRSKAGGFETSNECFTEWKRDKIKGVQELIDFRKANVCLKTYLGEESTVVNQRNGVVKKEWSGWPQFIVHHPDGSARIHCDFGVCATETFRMISKEPNLQNVPTHSDEGSITKMSFTVPPAPMIFITDKINNKDYEVTQIGCVNTKRGYVAALGVTLDDEIVDIGENTVLEYDEWSKNNIDPIAIQTIVDKYTETKEIVLENDRLKIRIDPYNKKAGKLCYLLMTQDAASLEARVATADTALNDTGVDPTLFAVYDPNSGYGEDLHSTTGKSVFCDATGIQINEVLDENGKTWLYVDKQEMNIKRDGKELRVKGSDILETDEILSYVDE